MKKRKCEEFLDIVVRIEKEKSGYFTYDKFIINPDMFYSFVFDKNETVNVWEDVRKLINSNFEGERKERLLNLVNCRIAFLKGSFQDNVDIELKKKYVANMKNYKQFFSEEAINYGMGRINLRDFMTRKNIYAPGIIDLYRKRGYIEEGTCEDYVSEKNPCNGRYRLVHKIGVTFLVPNEYQVKEKELIKMCMLYDYPYMKKYFDLEDKGISVRVYNLDSPFEFYITFLNRKPEDGASLYIPYICLKEKSIQPAVKRMNEYFSWYYTNPVDLKDNLNLMKTPLFKSLKEDIERGK